MAMIDGNMRGGASSGHQVSIGNKNLPRGMCDDFVALHKTVKCLVRLILVP